MYLREHPHSMSFELYSLSFAVDSDDPIRIVALGRSATTLAAPVSFRDPSHSGVPHLPCFAGAPSSHFPCFALSPLLPDLPNGTAPPIHMIKLPKRGKTRRRLWDAPPAGDRVKCRGQTPGIHRQRRAREIAAKFVG